MDKNLENTQELIKPDDVEALKKKYKENDGKCYEVTTTFCPDDLEEKTYTFIFRKPLPATYDRYVKTSSASASRALQTFVADNICDEQKEYLREALVEYPALAIGVGEKLLNMLGLSKDTTVKKAVDDEKESIKSSFVEYSKLVIYTYLPEKLQPDNFDELTIEEIYHYIAQTEVIREIRNHDESVAVHNGLASSLENQ